MSEDIKMDRKWLDLQSEEIGEVLAEQGLSLAVPMVFEQTYDPKDEISLGSMIDHTLLKPEAGRDQVRILCQEALEFQFASVCINPRFVSLAARELRGSSVKVCTVIGFPLGATTTLMKVLETRDAIADGADEIDMVLPVGSLKERNYADVYNDIASVVEAAGGRIVKVIMETSLLTKEEIVRASLLSKMAGAHFVKTSTGFGGGGATVEDIALMRRVVGPEMGVKASGGVRDRATALAMVEAGATRIGTSSGVAIVGNSQASGSDY